MEESKVGIITFHCSDNYGAMLQAYGLKKFLGMKDRKADIIPYAPPFMTGRHWWFPYVPNGGWVRCLRWMWWGGMLHLGMGKDFFWQKRNMKCFRKQYLLKNKKDKKILTENQLKKLSYLYYIVGSDQIWNPDITCGLRKAYFGAFENIHKKKVIAYAASLGGAELSSKYNARLAELLCYVDAVSLREEKAVPYIQRFYQGEVTAVLDPVFLLEKEEWKEIQKVPETGGYIFVYTTEHREELYDYAAQLAKYKKLQLIELQMNLGKKRKDWQIEYTAGPAEFLGYIDRADYVVTDSFHAIAFSIIYQKKFIAFVHSAFGTRTENILHICQLESRIFQVGREADIEAEIDWELVKQGLEAKIRVSEEFLMKHIPAE